MTVPTVSFPPVRRLGPDDLKRCVALSVDRGWSPEQSKWSLLLAASEVFGVDAPDGRGLAGAVVLTRWAADYASVGMMLVAARYGRRGLGRALMEHLLRAAGDDATVTLFATDMGRPLYEKLGFAPVRRNVSFVGALPPRRPVLATASRRGDVRGASARPPGRTCPPSSPWTVPRSARTAGRSSPACRPSRNRSSSSQAGGAAGRAIAGYAAAWRNTPASTVIGPLVAPDGEAAKRLVAGPGRAGAHAGPP